MENQIEIRREARLRRQCRKQGYRLIKSRIRNPHINNHGGYMIVDAWHNSVVKGADYELNLDDVAEFIK